MMTRTDAADKDRELVVCLLRHQGPRTLTGLGQVPELADWSAGRIEQAVVHAWAESQVSVDVEDRLLAL